MSKFKVGDKVVITAPENRDSGPSFTGYMERYDGGDAIVKSVLGYDGQHDGDGGWHTLEDCEHFYFAGDWMKKTVQFKGNK